MKTLLFTIFLSVLSVSSWSQNKGAGGGPGFNFRQKAASKEGKRWTLQEWMEQKNNNYIMDLWLGMYAPSPYEFFISGAQLSYTNKTNLTPATSPETANSFRSSQGALGAYALIIGLQGEYENNWEEKYNELNGSLNLRVLGNAIQGTHLILQYGQRTRNYQNLSAPLTISQPFAGAELDLYLMRYFGLHGLYRSFLTTTDSTLGDVNGSRSEAGAFIDFEAVRIFGHWYSDKQDQTRSGTITHIDRTGVVTGIKFFF